MKGTIEAIAPKETKEGKPYLRLNIGDEWYSYWGNQKLNKGDAIEFEIKENQLGDKVFKNAEEVKVIDEREQTQTSRDQKIRYNTLQILAEFNEKLTKEAFYEKADELSEYIRTGKRPTGE